MYGHALALLPKCTTHPDLQAVMVDDHSDRLLCTECARTLLTSAHHKGALNPIA